MTTNPASPWHGLGSLNLTPRTKPPTPADMDDDAFERPVMQRTVPAASAPSVVPANAFVLPWKAAGSAAASTDEPAAADNTEEKTDMRKKKTADAPTARAPKKQPTRGTSARFQICSLLLAKGDLSRAELLEDVSADRQAIYNAFFSGKKDGHIVFVTGTDKWHLTAAGKAWTTGGANLVNQQASSPPPKATRRKKEAAAKAPRETKTTPAASPVLAATVMALVNDKQPGAIVDRIQVVQERSFRCAVFSDGGFQLAKNGQAVDLTAAESKEMLRYLERMAEQPGA
jgi:hypothetical protein